MYAGKVCGDLVCLLLTERLHLEMGGLLYVSSALSVIVAFMSLFLFTDTDLIERDLGEMGDDDAPGDARGGATGAQASAAPATAAGVAQTTTEPPALTIDEVATLIAQKYGLTPRESDVLPLVLRGRTIARIQEELRISQGTVSTHTRHIYQKTGCHNRQALLDMAERMMAERRG